MNNIVFIRVPFLSAINTYGIIDNATFAYSLTGSYNLIPFADDSFDLYSTGGNYLTQLFFSGSGFWNGSGYSVATNYYFIDSFDAYSTGLISGYGVTGNGLSGIMYNQTGLKSGINLSGYSQTTGHFGYTIWSGYI